MSTFSVHMTLCPRRGDPEAQILSELLNVIVLDNVDWMLRKAAKGEEFPCCAKCGGVRYVPPTEHEFRNGHVTYDCAEIMLAKGCGPCGTIAAYDAAARRAKAILRGDVTLEESVNVAWAALIPSSGGYHAVVETPEKVIDVTAKMERGTSCTCCGARS